MGPVREGDAFVLFTSWVAIIGVDDLFDDSLKRAAGAHSWFNRFRKVLVRHEKLERSFIGLNHLAVAVITFRKVPLKVNVIYG